MKICIDSFGYATQIFDFQHMHTALHKYYHPSMNVEDFDKEGLATLNTEHVANQEQWFIVKSKSKTN